MIQPGWQHRSAPINGIRMHWVEQGEGPALVLAHGFPHSWFTWHRLIPVLAAEGWRVIAPDLRGMGETEGPADPASYDVIQTTDDLAGLLDHLGLEEAVFGGLDFGVFAIYDLARRHPERMTAIIGLENPHWPDRREIAPLAEAADWASRHFVHIHYFQEPGVAEAALDSDPRKFLSRVYYALSGDYDYMQVLQHPPGTAYIDALPAAPALPWRWLDTLELEYLVSDYARSGFRGGLNWYRAMDLRWAQRHPWRDIPCTVPFYFIGSEHDIDLKLWHGADPLGDIHKVYSEVRAIRMVGKAGHLMHLERSDEIATIFTEFLADIAAHRARKPV